MIESDPTKPRDKAIFDPMLIIIPVMIIHIKETVDLKEDEYEYLSNDI